MLTENLFCGVTKEKWVRKGENKDVDCGEISLRIVFQNPGLLSLYLPKLNCTKLQCDRLKKLTIYHQFMTALLIIPQLPSRCIIPTK